MQAGCEGEAHVTEAQVAMRVVLLDVEGGIERLGRAVPHRGHPVEHAAAAGREVKRARGRSLQEPYR